MVDPNFDVVPTLRMFDGLMMNKAADEIEFLRKRVADLEDLLVSTREICRRKGAETAWARFDAQIAKRGIGWVTARTFKVLRHDKE